ncbi:MAG: hypothetical protein KKD18_06785 [Nanoarchaeota archaeon]|nr:hypothetical protein [Nanoarchaeota archaeon]MBU0978097.1 hypothetical protein [Nanoarchaeota archaeon]
MEEYDWQRRKVSKFRDKTLRERFGSFVGQLRGAYQMAMQDNLPDEVVRDATDGLARLAVGVRDLEIQEFAAGRVLYSVRSTILDAHIGFVRSIYEQLDRQGDVSFLDFWN